MLPWGDRENGFNTEEIRSIGAYIRQLGGNTQFEPDTMPRLWAKGDPNLGSRLFTSNCSGCHGKLGEGVEGPALNNPAFQAAATDTFLVETISRGRVGTPMQGFSVGSVVRRSLTREEIEAIVVFIRTLGNK
jgi:mono/diheme cytochrome c family protein